MANRNLLAHVVTKFAPQQWENVASEALLYLLRRDESHRAMNSLLQPTGLRLEDVRWHSQASAESDSAIPDLVADDGLGRHALIVECKFWAGLTENQPLGYLRRQELQFVGSDDRRLLLFVAPAQRVDLLAQRLGLDLDSTPVPQGSLRVLNSPLGTVAVTSWGDVLAAIQHHFDASADHEGADDLAQLRGLCDRADRFATLPLASEDVDPVHAERVLRYYDILDAVVARLTQEGVLTTDGLQSRGTKQWWGRNVRAKQSGRIILLAVSLTRWSQNYPTPFWLYINGHTPDLNSAVESALGPDTPWHDASDRHLNIALQAPLHVENDEAVALLAATVARICSTFPAAEAVSGTDAAEPDPEA